MTQRTRLPFIAVLFFTLLAASAAHAAITLPNCAASAGFKNQPCEITRTSSATFATDGAPYAHFLDLTATFTIAGRPAIQIKGFVDGRSGSNAIVKFRFTPPINGSWSYSISSNPSDAGINVGSGSFSVGTSTSPGFLRRDIQFPKRVVRDNNTYPWIWGNTYYQIINKAAQGVAWQSAITNSISYGMTRFRILVWPWWGATTATSNDGQGLGNYKDTQPFTASARESPNYQDPNFAHLRTLDDILLHASNQGGFVELILFHDRASNTADPTPSRTFGRDTFGVLDTNVSKKYATYAVARYGAFPNVHFTLSQEWQNAYNVKSWWQDMGNHVRAADGHYGDFTTNRVRLLSIHPNQTLNFEFNGADRGQISGGVLSGWASYAQLQWSWRGKPLTTPPDKYGNDSVTANGSLNIPVFNDEFGYLAEEQAAGNLFTREESRQAMWGVVMGGGYGSVGDANDSNGSDITITSDWVFTSMYDDVKRMRDFFVTTVGNFHRLVSASLTGLVSGQTGGVRVYALRQASTRFVFYKANSGTFVITLPTNKTWQITKIDLTNPSAPPVTTSFTGTTTTLGSGDSNDWAYFVR